MHDDDNDRGGQEEGEDAEDNHEGEDVAAEAQALGLADRVLAALREAFGSCPAALPWVSEACGTGAVALWLTVETEGYGVFGVEGHLAAFALAVVREGTGGAQGHVHCLGGD